MSRGTRTWVNLAAIVAAAIGLIVLVLVRYAGGVLVDDSYSLTLPLPELGGAVPGQQVTVLGTSVGLIADADLTDDGVLVTLDISRDAAVPEHALVQVIRRSPVGEQVINFIPVPPDWTPPQGDIVPLSVPVADGWDAAPHGARLEPAEVVVPSEITPILEQAKRLFTALDVDDVSTLIRELDAAIGGRADLLRHLNRTAEDLNETLVDEGIPEFDRLIASSRTVLATLNDHREALASSFTHAANVSSFLAERRPTLDRLITQGRRALDQGTALLTDVRANLSCLNDDLLALNRRLVEPDVADDLATLLEENYWFWHAFDLGYVIDQDNPQLTWARVNFLLTEPFAGEPYAPHRATPPTLPGAACESPFGLGVNAVRGQNPQPPDPTSPGILYAPLVEGTHEPDPDPDPGERPGSSPGPQHPTPATGGGAIVLATATLAAAWTLRRKR